MALSAELNNGQPTRAFIESLKHGVEFHIRSNPLHALELADQAMALTADIDDPIAAAIALRAKAAAVHSVGRYDESLEHWNKAREIYIRNGCAADAASVQRCMVDALMYLGRYADALETAALARITLTELNDTVGLARLDTNVGNVYHRLDRNAEALRHYESALNAFREAGDGFGVALTSYNAANVQCNLHEFEAARERYRLAENVYRDRGMHLAAAQVRYSLGYLDFMTGHYHHAMRTLRAVEPEFERFGETRMAALCLLDLAEMCLQINLLCDSADFAARAGERFDGLSMRYEQAKAVMFRGLALMGLLRLDEAEGFLEEAGLIFTAEQNSLYMGLTAVYKAELELRRGAPHEALAKLAQVSDAFNRGDLGARQLQVRLIEARALKAAGMHAAALQQARNIAESVQGLNAIWLETEVNELLGDLFLEDGDCPAAYRCYLAAVECIEQRRANIRVDDFRSAFMRDKLRVYEKLVQRCLAENTAEQNARAFYYVESRKARTLVDVMTNDLDLWPASAALDPELVRQWKRVHEELQWLYAKVRSSEAAGDSRTLEVKYSLRSLTRAREEEMRCLALRAQMADPDFAALEGAGGLTVDELRRNLSSNDVLIEYYSAGGELSVFLVNQRSIEVIRIPVTLADVRERVLELKFLMDKFQYGPRYVEAHHKHLLTCANDSLQWLYETLFAPFEEQVNGRDLVIVPFDVLHGVPFHALFDGRRYLIDRCEIAYAPSARLYAMCRRNENRPRPNVTVFGVADKSAPHITNEIERICKSFPVAGKYVGSEATRDALLKIAGSTDVLHIASHAVFRQDNPMFSAFMLSDQWMNAYDIASLRMNSALVTLSGCSTGAGRVYAGDETLGLVRSFLRAGAAALVVSLWPVNDPSSAALMSCFYEELARGTKTRTALRTAILDSKTRYSNPYYWAPFVLIGHD